MTNPNIREQTYHYFLQEAPELLQVLEQELFSLKEDYNINKINNLMRATHTLKGAAASVGLETIATIAHSFEDVFKALFNPDLLIDFEIEALLFEGYECLHIILTAELTGRQVNHGEILDRTAAIFAQLQEKLGDCFSDESHIPNSVELGFDVTQSIFELGVTQRLEEIAAAAKSADLVVMATMLRTQAEIFLGLAESLNLQGFGAIAQMTIKALDTHPEQVETITHTALADFHAAREAVLNGDRISGGQPSLALQQLSGLPICATVEVEVHQPESLNTSVDEQQSATQSEFSEADLELSWNDSENAELVNPSLEAMWGELKETPASDNQAEQNVTVNTPLPRHLSFESTAIPNSPKDQPVVSRSVRVNVEHLEHLNYSIGELLTNQNRQSLQNAQIQTSVRALIARLQQHQQQLSQLQDWSDRQFNWVEQQQHQNWRLGSLPQFPIHNSQFLIHNNNFDSLELDRYTQAQLLVQSILEDAVQLAEATDAIDLFTQQSHQTLDKQRRLLTSTRDALMSARMLPLGEIFERFHRVLEQLIIRHNKQVALELHGTEVLVDKVVAEKLFDPLLHLVRNAYDHGIESPAIRQQQGKAQTGQIEISAEHQGKHLVIEVRDDGQGLDFEAIRQRAVQRQLVAAQNAGSLSEAALTAFLFEAGFSTAEGVNDLSGRGVGLDVVRAQLQPLNASISVYSEPDQGTTFTLRIPLSLTIAKLLLCQAGSHTYALLTNAIEQILIPQPDKIRSWDGGKVLRWGKGSQEQLIPIHKLSHILNYCSPVPKPLFSQPQPAAVLEGEMMPIILIRCQDALVGLEVDQLIGEQELVIRPLGSMIAPPSYVYGASILADGQLALVLDGVILMQYVADIQNQGRSELLALQYTTVRDLTNSTQQVLTSRQQPQLLPAQTPAALPASPQLDTRESLNKIILIVDDSITVRQTLALTLQQAGYQVIQAKDGWEAIEQLRYQQNIQLVICDIEMPRMNGFEFLKHRQQDSMLMTIPVVMLTSRSASKHRLIALELGANDYITKPYLEHQLLATILDAMEKKNLDVIV